MIAIDEPCLHHWIIESPSGPWSIAACKKCKKVDAFKNSMHETGWASLLKDGKNKEHNNIATKEEFLAQKKSELLPANGSKYKTEFKIRAVQEASTCGRAKVRKKYKIPETTLRGWIKRFT